MSRIEFLAINIAKGGSCSKGNFLGKFNRESTNPFVSTVGHVARDIDDARTVLVDIKATHLALSIEDAIALGRELEVLAVKPKVVFVYVSAFDAKAQRAAVMWCMRNMTMFKTIIHGANVSGMAIDMHRGMSPEASAIIGTMGMTTDDSESLDDKVLERMMNIVPTAYVLTPSTNGECEARKITPESMGSY